MKFFILTITVLFSTIVAEDMFCNRALYSTYDIGENMYTKDNGKYIYNTIIQVPVNHNKWLIEYGYDLEEIVYVKGTGSSRDMNYALAQAHDNALQNAACLDSEEIRVLFTVEEGSWKKKSFFQRLFRK